MAAALALFLVVLAPSVGYAVVSHGVIWGPQSVGSNGEKGVVVVAGNAFSAAAIELGKNPNDHQLFTDAVKSKLSNASTGGRFYEFVQTFECYGAGSVNSAGNLPWWAGAANLNMDMFFYTWASGYGDSQIWWSTYSPRLRAAALEDLQTVLSGGSLGGGGGGGSDDSEYLEFTGVPRYRTASTGRGFIKDGVIQWYATKSSNWDNDDIAKLWHPFTVRVPTAGISSFLSAHPSSDYDYWIRLGGTSSGSVYAIDIYAVKAYSATVKQGTNNDWAVGTSYISSVTSSEPVYRINTQSVTRRWDGDVYVVSFDSNNTGSVVADNTFSVDTLHDLLFEGANSHAGPPTPPNNWPDDDPTPTPTPPDPPEPTEPTPTPTPQPPLDPINPTGPTIPYEPEPDPPAPITPFVVQEPTNTSPTDYTPWLRAILNQLQEIDTDIVDGFNLVASELDKHCIHLQDALGDWVQWLDQSLQLMVNNQRLSLQSYLRYLFDDLAALLTNAIDGAIYDLELYMHEQMEWLAEQLEFDVSGGSFDDSTVVSWLKRIYLKMQGQSYHQPTVRPTEPEIESGFDWWSWLIDTLVSLLGKGAADGIDTLVGILEELNRLFPFSIPWDLVAIFTAIVAQPVTPVFDVVIPAIDGWWSEVTFHVDLQPYDGAAAAVRAMWLLWFAVCLAMRTDWLVGVFETGARVVTQFLDRL